MAEKSGRPAVPTTRVAEKAERTWSARLCRHPVLLALLMLNLTAAGLGVWSVGIEPRLLVVHEERLELRCWPASLAGLRVALLSDIHAGAPHIDAAQLRRVVARTNAAHPDLVVLLGEGVLQAEAPPVNACPNLRPLQPPAGLGARELAALVRTEGLWLAL